MLLSKLRNSLRMCAQTENFATKIALFPINLVAEHAKMKNIFPARIHSLFGANRKYPSILNESQCNYKNEHVPTGIAT